MDNQNEYYEVYYTELNNRCRLSCTFTWIDAMLAAAELEGGHWPKDVCVVPVIDGEGTDPLEGTVQQTTW